VAIVENGRFVALEPDPSHPTGRALCAKGRAAPELVYHSERLLHPLKRTRAKGDPNPGWQEISWEEALETTANRLRNIAAENGPESVVFSLASPSTSASADFTMWVERLMRAFGSPNLCVSMELCGWGRYFATSYTYGAGVPGVYMPDLENAGCILFWGYNPSLARLDHAVSTLAATRRGARLVVVDPRRVGLASKADIHLQPRPGTDAAIALGIAHVMIDRGWYDHGFIRDWTNAPLLVREDDGRFLTERDLSGSGSSARYVAWNRKSGRASLYDSARGSYDCDNSELALLGEYDVEATDGTVRCRPVFELVAANCRRYPPATVQRICGVERGDVESTARLLWENRPLAYYAWSGVEMQTNATQIARAIAQLHVLTGSFDVEGGNVLFPAVPTANVASAGLTERASPAPALGTRERPLGPARFQFATTEEMYRAILEHQPYRVRGLVGFGANILLSHSDGLRGRQALSALDFYVHLDLFMNPTAELADIVLPVTSAFEREALRVGFEVSTEAQSLVQLRHRIAEPRGEARSDAEIIFDLACLLGFADESGAATSMPPIAFNSTLRGFHSIHCGRTPRECGCHWSRGIESSPRRAMACQQDSIRQPARLSCTPR
jgi:anaerobic selenocysteine-containing dehydrogenase